MDHLILKYLNEELSAKEWEELQVWMKKREENQLYLNKLEAYWKDSEGDMIAVKRKIWNDLENRINPQNQPTQTLPISNLWKYLKVAAILLIISTLSLTTYYSNNTNDADVSILMVEKETMPGQKVTTKLPDGSTVTLNAESKIKFPEKFNSEKRELELFGEAFFEVTHDPDRPFYVKSNGSIVKVLGTSFNIRTYESENMISVAVATGRVSFTSPEANEEIVLMPNEMISYENGQNEIIKKQVDPLKVFGWRDRVLYFKNEGLDEIIEEVERWYGVRVIVKGDFDSHGNFTGEFRNKSLENVLIGLSYLYEFDYSIENGIVTLK